MELLIIVLVLYIFISPIYLFIRTRGLEKRIDQLSGKVPHTQDGHQTINTAAQSTETLPREGHQIAPQTVVQQQMDQRTREPLQFAPTGIKEHTFIDWMKEDFLVKLGGLLLLIGFGWFVSYAFMNNWIGPFGRILLGLLFGVGVLVLGTWRIGSRQHQGEIFTALGAGIILLTVFAARSIYDMFTPATALALMFASIVFVAFVSVRYKSNQLAVAGLLLGGIAPLLTAGGGNTIGLFSYLTVLVLGTLWVVALTGSRALTPVALTIVFFYGLPYMNGVFGREDELHALLFSFLFTTIFFVSNVFSIVRTRDGTTKSNHLYVALASGAYLIAWVSLAAAREWQSVLFVGWMLVFSFGAFAVYLRTSDRRPFYIYSAVAIALLAAATAVMLDGDTKLLAIAYMIEAGAIILAALRVLPHSKSSCYLGFLFVVPVLMTLESIDASTWYRSAIHIDFMVLSVAMVVLGIVGLGFMNAKKDALAYKYTASTLLIGSFVYLLILIWKVLHAVIPQDDTAVMFSLIIYTIFGLYAYIRGRSGGQKVVQKVGAVLLALVVMRLLLVDVWGMAIAGRIMTFFAVGVLLISTAFIGRSGRRENIPTDNK